MFAECNGAAQSPINIAECAADRNGAVDALELDWPSVAGASITHDGRLLQVRSLALWHKKSCRRV